MSGLKVRVDSNEDNNRWLDLTAVFTKKELPADVEKVATREKIENCDHLKNIANKMQKLRHRNWITHWSKLRKGTGTSRSNSK